VTIRVSAYAVIVDGRGRLLLPHWSEGDRSGWTMPGGGLELGEHPEDAMVREVLEETGYHVVVGELLGIDSLVIPAEQRLAPGVGRFQALRVVFRARVVGGALTAEQQGTTDSVAWFSPDEIDALDRVNLVDAARRMAGLIG